MNYSGRFVVRLSPEQHRSLKQEAEKLNISLNELIKQKLTEVEFQKPFLNAIRRQWGRHLLAVVMYGSVVRGDFRPSSDIDLLIVLGSQVKVQRQLYREWDESVAPQIGERFSPQFSHLPKSPDQVSSLWLEAALEGEIIYEQDRTVRRMMSQLKDMIVSGRYRRKMVHGFPYWVKESHAKP